MIIVIFLSTLLTARAEKGILEEIPANKNIKYVIKLENGDIITGYVAEFLSAPEEGEGIKFSTDLGLATIYESQIQLIVRESDYYRHSHRVFLLPTAEPIGDDYFIGAFELGFAYLGAGVGDMFSFTAGRSLIPGIRSDQQISVLNGKATLLQMPLGKTADKLSFALGGNLAFINHDNRLIHLYGTCTVKFHRSAITASVFNKLGSANYNRLNFGHNFVEMRYQDGAFGIGLGLDTKFKNVHGLHFIGELWNSNVTKPTNTAVFLGLRLAKYNFSSDFGLSFFTQPFVAPFASFVWTPFN